MSPLHERVEDPLEHRHLLVSASSCDCMAVIDCRWACTVWAMAFSCAADMAPGGLGRAAWTPDRTAP